MPIFPTPRTEHYTPQFLMQALDVSEPQAVWLLLSIDHYGWRAHADMTHSLIGAGPPPPGDDMVGHHFEHRVMAALEELFLLLDQLWRLIGAVQAHRVGERFLQAYSTYGGDLAAQYETLRGYDEATWAELLSVPTEAEVIQRAGPPRGSVEEAEWWVGFRAKVLRLCVVNMREVGAFFERPPSPMGGAIRTSLRDTNNAYRHGTLILYEDCSPMPSGWIAANPDDAMGVLLSAAEAAQVGRGPAVNVLQAIPDAGGRAQMAAVPMDAAWCQGLATSMGHLSVLMKRLARSFLLAETLHSRPLSAIEDFSWTPLTERSAGPG